MKCINVDQCMCSAAMFLEQEGIFIVPYLQSTSRDVLYFLFTFYNNLRVLKTFCNLNPYGISSFLKLHSFTKSSTFSQLNRKLYFIKFHSFENFFKKEGSKVLELYLGIFMLIEISKFSVKTLCFVGQGSKRYNSYDN